MPLLSLPDVTLHYSVQGDGPPLLLIPGMLSDQASWAPLLPLLGSRYRLILPDLRGAGRTVPWDAPISLAALSADMLALADHLGHARLAVAGHSLGGLVALAMARRAPERISHLIALASTPRGTARLPHLFATLCDIRAGTDGETLWLRAVFPWLFHDRFFRDTGAVEAAVTASRAYPHAQGLAAMRHQSDALGQLDLNALPRTVTMPALALLASEDAMIAPEAAEAAWIGMGAECQRIARAGHSLHWDQPEVVAQAMTGFLDRRPA